MTTRRSARDYAIAINVEFERIFQLMSAPPQLINVGLAPDDGTADLMAVGLEKILDNLTRIAPL